MDTREIEFVVVEVTIDFMESSEKCEPYSVQYSLDAHDTKTGKLLIPNIPVKQMIPTNPERIRTEALYVYEKINNLPMEGDSI